MTTQEAPTLAPIAQNLTRKAPLVEGTFEADVPSGDSVTMQAQINMESRLSRQLVPIDPYTFALTAMPLLDDRIKFSNFTTTTGKPIESLREWIRAVELGEWPG